MNSKQQRGFSLIELLVVVTILGVLAAIIVPRITLTATTAETRADEQNRARVNSAVERYYIENGSWPADLNTLATDADYFPDGIPNSPLTGSAYTLNSTTHRVE
jgi:general secretion pathway protein G